MSTYRVPKCGHHFVKFDDVTIYPVLVVARTVQATWPKTFSFVANGNCFARLRINTTCFGIIKYLVKKTKFKFKDVFNDVPVKQWQAVKIQLDLMSEPPHTWVSSSKRATCHGHAPSPLMLPPTIRLLITWDLVHALPYRLFWGRRNRFPHDWKSLIQSKKAFYMLKPPTNKI